MKVLVINGHPDPGAARLCHALAGAYCDGAAGAGHDVKRIDVGTLDVPYLRSAEDFADAGVPADIARAREAIQAADHLVFIYPLWLGMLPALFKAFLEQVCRGNFAMEIKANGWVPQLKGKSARVVVTMGMPALVYRLFFLAHSLAALRRNILGFSGVRPVRSSIFGRVEQVSAERRAQWLDEMRKLGAKAR